MLFRSRYIYDFALPAEKPGRTASAHVAAGLDFDIWHGDLVSGETLHVARLRAGKGQRGQMHSHPNEQFLFVVEGSVSAEIGGCTHMVGRHCVLHVPPDMAHCIGTADQDALVIVLQDTRHPFAA